MVNNLAFAPIIPHVIQILHGVNKLGMNDSDQPTAEQKHLLFGVVGGCSRPFAQTVNSIDVNTSLKSRLSAVIILESVPCPGPTLLGSRASPEISLIGVQKVLARKRFVDLNHDRRSCPSLESREDGTRQLSSS